MNDYLGHLIVTAGRAEFCTSDGREWRLRQPTPEEAADGDSAYRLAHRRVMDDVRLAELAGSEAALAREASTRGAAAEAVYLLPLLLEKPDGERPFDVHNPESLKRFEELEPAIVQEMVRAYWDVIQRAAIEAKKKSLQTS